MVFRTWQALASDSDAASAYARHLVAEVLPAREQVDGHLGAQLLTRETDDGIEILVITRWQSMAAISGFAGTHIDRAVVEPAARAALLSWDEHVAHYDVLIDSPLEAAGS